MGTQYNFKKSTHHIIIIIIISKQINKIQKAFIRIKNSVNTIKKNTFYQYKQSWAELQSTSKQKSGKEGLETLQYDSESRNKWEGT